MSEKINEIRIASTQFDLRPVANDAEFFSRVKKLCTRAAEQKASLIVLPEYFSMSWLITIAEQNFAEALKVFSRCQSRFDEILSALARQLQMVIVAGTVPQRWDGQVINRSYIYHPDGSKSHQDKKNMTRFESEQWGISAGDRHVTVFEHQGVRFGVAICYDVEFSSYIEELVRQDVDFILVPSCTDDVHGYWRVRHCAQARAIESQSYVVMSSTVGGDPQFSEIDTNYGRAGFFTPCDVGFPDGGELGLGTLNKEDVHVAVFNMARLREIRISGTVLNRRDQHVR